MRPLLSAILFVGLAFPASSQEKKVDDLLKKAEAEMQSGNLDKALALCDQAAVADAKSTTVLFLRANIYDALGKNADAVRDFSKIIALDPKLAETYQARGSSQFKLGKIQESIADFDKYLEMKPDRKAGHWQRGISYYYVGRFADGKKQFEGYQTVDSNDVENAVWCLMCQARIDGLDKARKDALKIGKDQRVPMAEVYDLFMGKIQPEAVIDAARKNKTVRTQDDPLFYAHLYVGLYYEIAGDGKKAFEHLNKATEDYRHPHYMWHVARVHRDMLKMAEKK